MYYCKSSYFRYFQKYNFKVWCVYSQNLPGTGEEDKTMVMCCPSLPSLPPFPHKAVSGPQLGQNKGKGEGKPG